MHRAGLRYLYVGWQLYREEGLAGEEAKLWLLDEILTVEHAGELLLAYEVDYDVAAGRSGAGRLPIFGYDQG